MSDLIIIALLAIIALKIPQEDGKFKGSNVFASVILFCVTVDIFLD
jgi:hypothetical protein